MAIRTGKAVWEGDLPRGKGTVKFGSFESAYSFSSRFENGTGTNPEEMIAAAHAGCYSMALSHGLATAGFTPRKVETTSKVHLDKVGDGFKIASIDLETIADVPGIDNAKFMEIAEATKTGCPVSQALSSVEMKLNAKLV